MDDTVKNNNKDTLNKIIGNLKFILENEIELDYVSTTRIKVLNNAIERLIEFNSHKEYESVAE